MGQITQPSAPGITIIPVDRENGPGAGAGASGNNHIFLGLNAGNNSSVANAIIIGSNSGAAGIVDPNLNGSTIIGANSLQSLVNAPPAKGAPITVVGENIASAQSRLGDSVLIGTSIMPVYAQAVYQNGNLQLIGNRIFTQTTAGIWLNNTIIGNDVLTGTVCAAQLSTIIGSQNLTGAAGNTANSLICIGQGNCGNSNGNANVNIVIGNSSGNSISGDNNTIIVGHSSDSNGSGQTYGYNNIFGNNSTAIGGDSNLLLGTAISTQGSRNIFIGTGAGNGVSLSTNDLFIVETYNPAVPGGNVKNCMFYGDLSAGNLIVGKSTTGTNRDMNGTNTLKLLNGTKTGNPIGGGYFYVSAGALHWVGSSGTDTAIAPA